MSIHYLDGTPTLKGSLTTFTTPDGAVHEIIGPSPKRRSIMFYIDSQVGGNAGVRPGGVNAPSAFIALGTSQQPLILRLEDFGSIIQGPFSAQSAAGGVLIGILECFET